MFCVCACMISEAYHAAKKNPLPTWSQDLKSKRELKNKTKHRIIHQYWYLASFEQPRDGMTIPSTACKEPMAKSRHWWSVLGPVKVQPRWISLDRPSHSSTKTEKRKRKKKRKNKKREKNGSIKYSLAFLWYSATLKKMHRKIPSIKMPKSE